MKELTKEDMRKITGGIDLTAPMLNAIYRVFDLIFEVGESLGSYWRRKNEGKMCDI